MSSWVLVTLSKEIAGQELKKIQKYFVVVADNVETAAGIAALPLMRCRPRLVHVSPSPRAFSDSPARFFLVLRYIFMGLN
jgi:hypothetical protein